MTGAALRRLPPAYTRLETDDELCVRLRAAHPHAIRYFEEPADAFAERYRIQRRLVEVYP